MKLESGLWISLKLTVLALQMNPKAAKWRNHGTVAVRLITHESKIVVRMFISRRVEKEIEDIIGDDQFEFK